MKLNGTGSFDSTEPELSTEHCAEGCSICRGAENGKPDTVIVVMAWFMNGTVNFSVMDTRVFWII